MQFVIEKKKKPTTTTTPKMQLSKCDHVQSFSKLSQITHPKSITHYHYHYHYHHYRYHHYYHHDHHHQQQQQQQYQQQLIRRIEHRVGHGQQHHFDQQYQQYHDQQQRFSRATQNQSAVHIQAKNTTTTAATVKHINGTKPFVTLRWLVVKSDDQQRQYRPTRPNKYNKVLCRYWVMWCWR